MNSAVLLISCPDKKGIVAAVSDFIFQNKGNILHADEHLDSEQGLFLMRIEWSLDSFMLKEKTFKKKFAEIAKNFQMDWKVIYSGEKSKVAIMVSKDLHCLTDLLYRQKAGELNCEIGLIISNHKDARELAKFYNIPFRHINYEDKDKAETTVLGLLKKNSIDLVILARFMQILSSKFVDSYPKRIINIHHSFLPAFIGAKPYHQAYKRGVKLIGATAHYVTSDLDQGPIIEQDIMRISHRDSVIDLVQKGKDLEKIILSRAVKWHLENRVLSYSNKTVVFN